MGSPLILQLLTPLPARGLAPSAITGIVIDSPIPALLLLSVIAADVRIPSLDGFPLRAAFHPANPRSSAAVLILHQCDREAGSYQTGWESLFPLLHARGISVLAPDFRGYGGSRNGKSDEENARYNEADVSAAFSYLQSHAKATRIAILGASCGCRRGAPLAAANLSTAPSAPAGNAKVAALICVSGSVGRPNPDPAFQAIATLPVLAIAAENDEPWASQMRRIYDQSTNPASQFWLHKGDQHGAPLLKQDPQMASAIANWIAFHLTAAAR